jgi:hypothetical protein
MRADHDGELSYLQFKTVDLPEPPPGWYEFDYSVLWNGLLVLVRTDADIWDQIARHEYRTKRHGQQDWPKLWPCNLRLSLFDGRRERDVLKLPVSGSPHVTMTPEGNWLIAVWCSETCIYNAKLVDPRGGLIREFIVGEGVQHLRCARDGTIWVSYTDRGVYARCPGEDVPVSAGGVVQFSSEGEPLWTLNDDGPVYADHCYAFTLDGDQAWSYTFGEWEISRLGNDARGWRNRVTFADALAVHKNHALLAGDYGEGSDRLALLCFGKKYALLLRTWTLEPRPSRRSPFLAQGNGDTLHYVHSGKWRRIQVQELVGLHQMMGID